MLSLLTLTSHIYVSSTSPTSQKIFGHWVHWLHTHQVLFLNYQVPEVLLGLIPGQTRTRGRKPACTHSFNAIMKNDQLVFVKFFGLMQPQPIFLVHFYVKNRVLSGGRFAPQGTLATFGDTSGCHN